MTDDPNNWRGWQKQIVDELDVERERRIGFLGDYLVANGLRTFVLGISGGVDSSTAGRLAQLSVERLRARRYEAHFVAVRLPYGMQRVEEDARLAHSSDDGTPRQPRQAVFSH